MTIVSVTAARGSGDYTVFNLVDSEGDPVDLTALGATAVKVSVCDPRACIDSSTSDVTFSGSTVSVKFGKLGLPPTRNNNLPYYPKISYTVPADSDPRILAGEGYATEIRLRVVC